MSDKDKQIKALYGDNSNKATLFNTLLLPDEKDGKKDGQASDKGKTETSAKAKTEVVVKVPSYEWTQSQTAFEVQWPIPKECKGKDVVFNCTPDKLEIKLKLGNMKRGIAKEKMEDKNLDLPDEVTLCSGKLDGPVKPDEVFWYLEEPEITSKGAKNKKTTPNEGKIANYNLLKVTAAKKDIQKFGCLFRGDPQIDRTKIRWFSSSIEQLKSQMAGS